MTDIDKPDEEKPDTSDEKIEDEFEEESQPESEDLKEETDDTEEIEEEDTEETVSENEDKEPSEKIIEKQPKEKAQPETSKKEKHGKEEDKKEKQKKRIDRGPDFKYIVRLSNTDVDGEKNVIYGLSNVRGIGLHMATFIADTAGVDRYKKMGDLTDDQVTKLQGAIDNVSKNAPGWMLNHRKDYETGNNFHLVSTDIDTRLRDEINIMKKIRSYRGIRHERGLPVRGQRTRANNRKGLALGVSKKREAPETASTAK